jgi:hypothetical protein
MLSDSKLDMLSSELCSSVIAMDSHISFVAIIDEKGRVRQSQGNNAIIKKLLGTKKDMFFMENVLMNRMRADFDVDLGEIRFTYVERSKRSVLYFPLDNQLLIVSFVRTPINSLTLARSITLLVCRYKKKLKKMS